MLITKIILLCFMTLATAKMFDVCIIGAGPAGITAAVNLAQQQFRVIILDKGPGNGALDNNTWITRVPVPDKIRAPNMLKNFMLRSFDGYRNIHYFMGEVISIVRSKPGSHGHFVVEAEGGKLTTKRILLATGYEILYPEIPGYKDTWMKVLFNEPLSDGSKGHMGAYSSAVLATDASGSVSAAMHLARIALHYTKKVTIYTNRNQKLTDDLSRYLETAVTTELLQKITVDNREIQTLHEIEIKGRNSRKKYAESHSIVIFFADGNDARHSFMFHTPTGRLNVDFAEELNVRLTDGGLIKADPSSMETTEKGVYAAGDCVSFKRTVIRSMFTAQLAAEAIAISLFYDR